MLDAMQTLLRDVVRERPPRRLRARRACDGGPRDRAREDPRAPERARRARGDLRAQRDRGHQPRRLRLGAADARPRRPRARHRARAPLELRPLAVHRAAHRRRVPDDPTHRHGRARPRRARRASSATEQPEGRRAQPRLERARHGQRRSTGSRNGRTSRARSSSCDAAQAAPHRAVDVQADRLRLRRHLGPQDVRAERYRRGLGPRRPARADGAVPARRAHDPQGAGRRDDVGRAAAQVRGRHRADGRGGRLRRRRSTTSTRSASTRSSRTSTT